MNKIFIGDSLTVLKSLKSESVQTCVTSPPYYGLRDYGMKRQMGLEETPEAYIQKMVELFCEVKRVLRDDGTLWLNLGDSYGKGKQLLGIPWRLALALQDAGWVLRQDIIWAKPNPMPESVTDRCTKSHEYIFLLTKSAKYVYDCDAIREPLGKDQREAGLIRARRLGYDGKGTYQDWYNKKRNRTDWVDKKTSGDNLTFGQAMRSSATKPTALPHPIGKNKRSVWNVTPKPYLGAHFATFPPALIEPCILAGAPKNAIVLDPFFGSGTTGAVALALGRQYIGIELNPAYVTLARERLQTVELPLSA